jgi:hypothetical protein
MHDYSPIFSEKIRNDLDVEIFMDSIVVENLSPTITPSFSTTSIAANHRGDGITVIVDHSVNVSASSLLATSTGVSGTETCFPGDVLRFRT